MPELKDMLRKRGTGEEETQSASSKKNLVITGYRNTNAYPISVRSGNKSFALNPGQWLKNRAGERVTSKDFMAYVGPGKLSVTREQVSGDVEEVKLEGQDDPLKNPYHRGPAPAVQEAAPAPVGHKGFQEPLPGAPAKE